MKKVLFFLALLSVLVSCKEEIIKKPKKLIEKDIMIDIIYDLSILEAIKYQHLTSAEDYNTNPTAFILKKYKVDSLQFAKSNSYYATNYKEYKKMYKTVNDRLEKNKLALDTLIAAENKKQKALKKSKEKTNLKK
ncbi:DUF4296 domain-containing protein [Flavobacterium sp.]|uniref:DUF4296 domain-containing protein n=1 Tax=Flavobacterium sp. TaxID=239 RepID=UPI00286BB9E0|nr:DUF4296 domain-containing protein [Flavobacterium sp.]